MPRGGIANSWDVGISSGGEVIGMKLDYKGKTIEVLGGDITKIVVDAVVNAANEGLLGGGGVDGAIHRVGGPAIAEESRKIGHCPTGGAVITSGGRLPAKWVIHAVGPVWHGGAGGEAGLLRGAYENSLRIAKEHGMKSIAFPSISTGAYGYPIEQAAPIAIGTVLDALDGETTLEKVVFVLFSEDDYGVYVREVKEIVEARPSTGVQ
jgi:O-acetyl-ADP-ribose deacetylase (regulator of RNase III)